MYQDVVVLLPGFLGFGHFGGFYYFGDRVSAALRGALEMQSGRPWPVIPVSTVPTGSLADRQEYLMSALTKLDGALGGVQRFHLVGHSAGGVDAFLLTREHPFGARPSDPGRVRDKIRSVVTIGSPHYGTGLANSDPAQFLGNPLAHMGGLSTIGKAVVDILRTAPNEPDLPATVASALQDWRESFAFLGHVLQHRELIQALRPERMAELQARCRPDPDVNARLVCFVTATPPPPDDNTKSDPLYRDLYALTSRGITSLAQAPTETLRVLENLGDDRVIKASDADPLLTIDPVTNDGIVTTACQLVNPDRPEELGGLVIADHGDVLGHYPRADLMASLDDPNGKKTINVGLFHSGANFRDDQFFELYRRVGRAILQNL